MKFTRRALGATAIALAFASPVLAQEKGYVGIAMPTKSSARWIDERLPARWRTPPVRISRSSPTTA